jgi:hypothetical protein
MDNQINNKLNILSLNVRLLTAAFGLIKISKNNGHRAQLIRNEILKFNNVDVIMLQEAFNTTIVEREIFNHIKHIYPYKYIDQRTPAFIFGVNSGLVIFSKYPIIDKTIYTYKMWTGDELFAKKSIMGVKIEIPLQNTLHTAYVFNTHLQAGASDNIFINSLSRFFDRSYKGINVVTDKLSTNQIRLMELYESQEVINNFVNKHENNQNKQNIYYGGDFNINYYDNTTFYNPLEKNDIKVNEMIETIFPRSLTFDENKTESFSTVYSSKKIIDYIV